ncbi:sugar ABC transporter substrate-binding protein [Microbacterium sp. LWH10-1.2]|uniref:sugar ABC transporter substrate-binding protein n=1 Tax=Microbacterium sp. LWH10-1.2 TaxID=3135255 RepID=UPI003139FA24
MSRVTKLCQPVEQPARAPDALARPTDRGKPMQSFSKSRRLATVTATIIAVALVSTACSPGGSGNSANASCEEEYTIGFSHPASEASAVKVVKEAAAAHAEELGCITVLLDNTSGMNLETQRSTLESWVTQKVDAIVVLPVDPAALENLREKAQSQGTKWLTYVASNPEEDGTVGFDNETAGKDMAAYLDEWIAEKHPDGDITAAVTTATPLPSIQPRVLPAISLLESSGIDVVSQQDCAAQDCGLQLAEDALRAHPNLRVFIGLNDDAALGALRAFQNAKVDLDEVFVAGFDGAEEALVSLRDKTGYTASSAIPTIELGASVVDNAIAAITGDGDASKQTPMFLVNPSDSEKIAELLKAYTTFGK